ncbi:MAG TPA: 5'-3' exonuclease, partial [Acholeplasma sp.]|nr:5'-3' exonuclease [Acholeplasma sp.]
MKKLILIDGHSLFFRAYYATAYSRSGLMQNKDGLY